MERLRYINDVEDIEAFFAFKQILIFLIKKFKWVTPLADVDTLRSEQKVIYYNIDWLN